MVEICSLAVLLRPLTLDEVIPRGDTSLLVAFDGAWDRPLYLPKLIAFLGAADLAPAALAPVVLATIFVLEGAFVVLTCTAESAEALLRVLCRVRICKGIMFTSLTVVTLFDKPAPVRRFVRDVTALSWREETVCRLLLDRLRSGVIARVLALCSCALGSTAVEWAAWSVFWG